MSSIKVLICVLCIATILKVSSLKVKTITDELENKINEYNNSVDKKAFTATDLHQLRKISATSLSPDNKYLVFQLSQWNKATGKTTTKINYYEISTKKLSEVTFEGNSPAFAKDFPDKIFFLSNDSKSILSAEFPNKDSKVTEVAKYPLEIDGFKIAKSGNALVFSANVYYENGDDLDATVQKNEEVKDQGWQVYDELMVNHWDKWNNKKVNNVFYQPLINLVANGKPQNLMKKEFLKEANSPIPPFGGSEMYDISPDGSKVAFTVSLRLNEHVNTNWRIYLSNQGNQPEDITTNQDKEKNFEGRTQNPKFSDDGSKLYFSAMPRPWLESDYLYLVEYTLKTVDLDPQIRKLTQFFDYTIGDYIIDNDNIVFSVDYDGATEHFAVPLNEPSLEKIVRLTNWDSIKSSKESPLAVVYSDTEKKYLLYSIETSDLFPNRISVFKYDNNSWTKPTTTVEVVYEPNPEFSANFYGDVSQQEKFHFEGTTNKSVQGWLIKPIKFEEGKKYPIAMIIHGGPEGSLGNTWSYRWNPLLWASRGYAVVMVNPEGSTGLGQKFVDAVRNDWGGAPYNTLMDGLKFAINNYPFLDSDNACAAGASFGGYMVNWIQGNDLFKFKCLVTHDGVFSTLSMFYITDEMWFPLAEYCPVEKPGCTPYDPDPLIRNGFTRWSPELLVDKWSTPHLIIHGSNDLRIPVSEGLSAFTALQMKKVPSKFLHFTQENHWVMKQENSIVWYDNVLGWLDKYTNNSSKDSKKLIN